MSPPSLPSLPPQPAPPLRKCSSGVPRAAQEMLCTLRVSQAIFCPRTGGRSGQQQSVIAVSCFLPLSLWLFLCLCNLQSVFLRLCVWSCLCICLSVLRVSWTNALRYLSLHDCLPTYPPKLSSVPPLPESFSRPLLSSLDTLPLCAQSSVQDALRALCCVGEPCLCLLAGL